MGPIFYLAALAQVLGFALSVDPLAAVGGKRRQHPVVAAPPDFSVGIRVRIRLLVNLQLTGQ